MTGDSELRMTIDTLLYTAEISELITGYVCIRFSLLLLLTITILLLLPSPPPLPTFPPSLESGRFSVCKCPTITTPQTPFTYWLSDF